MEKYAPNSLDLAPRDVVARSIETEIREGRGYDGGYVHLDLTHLGADNIMERLPGIRQIAMDFAGVDPINDPVPVQPGQHYSMGGIDVDINGATILPGLYAAGECACISVHGANRLGGNSLLETVVYGRLVADKIIEDNQIYLEPDIEDVKLAVIDIEDKIGDIMDRDDNGNFYRVKNAITDIMFSKFGIFRDSVGMDDGLAEIRSLQKQFSKLSPINKDRAFNQSLIQFLEVEGMLKLSEIIALSAIERKESRGSHTRIDHPERDDVNFLKHTISILKGEEIDIKYKPVILGMFEPKERVY